MRFNHFDNTIFGITITGQGTNVVEGTHRAILRSLVSTLARRLSLRLASWRAIKCTPAAAMMPAMAMCPQYADRCQRVGVEPRGPVGVC